MSDSSTGRNGPHDQEEDGASRRPPGIHAHVIRLVINAAALWLAAQVVGGIEIEGTRSLLGAAFIFGVVNLFIKPVVRALGLPLTCLTLGLFALVINAGMLLLTARIAGLFDLVVTVDGFQAAFLGALLVSIVSTLLGVLVERPLWRAIRRRRSSYEEADE